MFKYLEASRIIAASPTNCDLCSEIEEGPTDLAVLDGNAATNSAVFWPGAQLLGLRMAGEFNRVLRDV